jgi:hypothetical protein
VGRGGRKRTGWERPKKCWLLNLGSRGRQTAFLRAGAAAARGERGGDKGQLGLPPRGWLESLESWCRRRAAKTGHPAFFRAAQSVMRCPPPGTPRRGGALLLLSLGHAPPGPSIATIATWPPPARPPQLV